jgi:hypothetical protein
MEDISTDEIYSLHYKKNKSGAIRYTQNNEALIICKKLINLIISPMNAINNIKLTKK